MIDMSGGLNVQPEPCPRRCFRTAFSAAGLSACREGLEAGIVVMNHGRVPGQDGAP